MEQRGVKVDCDYTISEMGVKKVPTLDFDEEDVKSIAKKIADEAGLNLNKKS